MARVCVLQFRAAATRPATKLSSSGGTAPRLFTSKHHSPARNGSQARRGRRTECRSGAVPTRSTYWSTAAVGQRRTERLDHLGDDRARGLHRKPAVHSARGNACPQCVRSSALQCPKPPSPPCRRGRSLLGACLAVDAETKLVDVPVQARVARLTCTGPLRGSIESRLVRSSSLPNRGQARTKQNRPGSGLLCGGPTRTRNCTRLTSSASAAERARR